MPMAEPLQNTALFKKLHIALFLLVMLLVTSSAHAQSLLLPGDMVFVSVNSTTDSFEFIPLINLEEGTQFSISNGIWENKNQAFSDEEVVTFLSLGTIVAGTPISFKNGKAKGFQVDGSLSFTKKSERLFVYQQDQDLKRFIYLLGWGEKQNRRDKSFFGSDIPEVLEEHKNTVLKLGESNNYQYFIKNGASGTPKMLLGFIAEPSYWRSNDEKGFLTFGTSFNILKAPVILFDESLSSTKENIAQRSLNVAIYEHDGSKLTVDVVYDSVNSSLSRAEIKDFKSKQINFTGLIGDAVYEIELPVVNDEEYEGIETAIFTLENLSKGRFGDFISHALIVSDDEIPEIKLELVTYLDQTLLLVHNLESKRVDLNNWEIARDDFRVNFYRNDFLEVGETLVIVNAKDGAQQLPFNKLKIVNVDEFNLFESGETLELKDSEDNRIASLSIPKNRNINNDSNTFASGESNTSSSVKRDASDNSETNTVNTHSKVLVKPGWKHITSSELKNAEYPELDFYYWDNKELKFKSIDQELSGSDDMILLGYFDDDAAKNLQEKKKPTSDTKADSKIRINVSAIDVDQNGRIEEAEGLNLVINSSERAFRVSAFTNALKEKLNLSYLPELFYSAENFESISKFENDATILPNKLFWVKFKSIIEKEEFEIDVETLNAEQIDLKDEIEKGLLELEIIGGKEPVSLSVSFLKDDEELNNEVTLDLYKELYLNDFKNTSFSAFSSENNYSVFEIKRTSNNVTRLPLNFASSKDGEFELKVKEWIDIPEGWVIKIKDLKEDRSYELNESWSFKFDYFNSANLDDNREQNEIRFPTIEDRFVLRVIPESQLINEIEDELPKSVELHQNYPNPFNPSTTLSFYMPEEGEIKLSIFNIVGQPVAVLLEGTRAQGEHSLEWDASDMPSGIYIYQLEVGTKIMTRKMTLVK